MTFATEPSPLFQLGQVVSTPGVLRLIKESGIDACGLLARHRYGDYGNLCSHDKKANDAAVMDGSRIMSVYPLPGGMTIWIITDAAGDDGKRASTTLLLPDEY